VWLVACGPGSSDDFTAPQVLGGVEISPAQLNEGKRLYRLYCASCHGTAGDGGGPAGAGLDPAPREFESGTFLYKSTSGDALPTDEDLRRVIRDGIPARGMPGWVGLRSEDLDALANYLKTFSPRWRAHPGS
jgi:mono/diheme cytochrome c family protein